MHKNDIAKDIAENLTTVNRPVSAALVTEILDDFAGLVIDRAKAQEATAWPALGKFVGRHQAARTATNPATGGTVDVPAKTVLKFTPGAKVKRQVNGEE
jgi:DNA-binding protein HU-beta